VFGFKCFLFDSGVAENLAIAWLLERARWTGARTHAPDEARVVDPLRLQHRHPLTPYCGPALLGLVRETWLRGKPLDLDVPRGELLVRG
jgi:hypothetical protein